MKTISIALAAHYASETTTVCTCWYVLRSDAVALGFTDHDRDLVIDGVTYSASSGYTGTEVGTSGDMNADSTELEGMLVSPSITEDDLRAGLWDFAAVEIFQVNYADLTMGRYRQRVGHIGEVSLDRGQFKAELRGLLQAYSTSILEVTSPACRANLGDERCRVDLTPFTVESTITGVNVDGVTLYDDARTEPGPSGGVAIANVSNANPGVVTTVEPHLLTEDEQISIAGVIGPSTINTITIAQNVTADTFELGVDTSDTTAYPPYVSGGTVTALGAESGYFDHGEITFTSGLNAGFTREIKAYEPGQITLFLPFPYEVVAGDAYTMHAGCDKQLATCRDRFDNINNMRAEPYLPGLDRLVQQGRRQ